MSCIHHDHLPGCTGSAEFARLAQRVKELEAEREAVFAKDFKAAGVTPYTVETLNDEREDLNQPPQYDRISAALIRLEKAEADNARLRALIALREYGNDGHCPWCDREARDLEHAYDCKAFTQDRKVK